MLTSDLFAGLESKVTQAANLLVYGTSSPCCGISSEGAIKVGSENIADVIYGFENHLMKDEKARQCVMQRALFDTFGTASIEDLPQEVREAFLEGIDSGNSYYSLVYQGLEHMSQHPELYGEVIARAYQLTIFRDPYEEEIDYWKEQGTLSFILLVAGLEHWARRNQPGLMVTGGVATVWFQCEFLDTLVLSPKLAAEICDALENPSEEGCFVISPNGSVLKSSGDVAFIAVGNEALRGVQ